MKKGKIFSLFSAVCAICFFITPVNALANDNIVSFDQMNEQTSIYLDVAEGAYNDSNYSDVTVMAALSDPEIKTYDKPQGYTISISQSSTITLYDEDTEESWTDSAEEGEYTIYNLIPEHIYTYTVKNSDSTTVDSGRIKATGTLRMIYLTDIYNCRDIGGWECDEGTVKYGLIYRGSQLEYTNQSEQTTVFVNESNENYLVNACGIGYEIDLRDEDETPVYESALGDDVGYQRFALPQDSYINHVNLNGDSYTVTAKCLEQVMKNVINGIPTYIHCAAGADRTGTICFLLEALLGVSQADCDKDYELTCFSSGADYTDRLRTSGNWIDLVSYFNSFVGKNIQEKVASWCNEAGIDDELIESYREAMIDGYTSSAESDEDDADTVEDADMQALASASTEDNNTNLLAFYIFAAYFVIINIAGFILVLIDKRNASNDKKRVKHKTFKAVAILMGGAGIILGMMCMRDKLNHKKLVKKVVTVTVVEYFIAELVILVITHF
ncbi:MAG: DUF1294 domain-containing protein [Clostridiales bacterium]|nr:DUF1294 domain-containing protein [Clostridiales bacterium]